MTRPSDSGGGGWWGGSVKNTRPSAATARSFGARNPSSARYRTLPSSSACCRPGTAGRYSGGSAKRPSFEKSMPPFCVTRIEPSAASAAPLAPPPVSARRSTAPVETRIRWSAPSATLVTTSVSSPHHTGPSPKRMPSQTSSLSTRAPSSLYRHRRKCKVPDRDDDTSGSRDQLHPQPAPAWGRGARVRDRGRRAQHDGHAPGPTHGDHERARHG